MPRFNMILLCSTVLAGYAVPAIAADAQAAPASDPQTSATASTATPDQQGLSDIVVTASRRSENLQKVPVTIVAFQAKQLDSLAIKSTTDLPQLISGYSIIRTIAGANSYLRGVGTSNSGFTSESPVALYVDGLYLQNSAAAVFSFNNIERVEVLKGPQGTLYGRNTTGGLIQVITRDPGDVTTVDATLGYDTYRTLTANVYGSTPLSDTVSVNFAGTYTDQNKPWGRNILTGDGVGYLNDRGAQAKLRWEPSSDTKVTLRGFFDRTSTDQGAETAVYPGSLGVDGTPYLGEYRNAAREKAYLVTQQYHLSAKVEQDVGFAEFTSTTGYVDSKTNFLNIQNGIPGNPVTGQAAATLQANAHSKSFSQELQLTSKANGGPFQWIVGAFYYHDDTMVQANVYGTCIGTVCAGSPLPTRTTGYPLTRSYSGYADGSYNVTPTTKITFGLRYTSDNKSLTGLVVPLPGRPNSVAALPPSVITYPGQPFTGNPTGIDTNVTFSKLTFRGVLSQDLSDQIHAYVSFNRGFKAGGFNPVGFTNPPSRPEVLDAYEAGIKSDLFDHKVRLNVAGFYYDYKDIQLRSTAPPALPGSVILYNAASAHTKGVDVDFTVAPTRGLTFTGGFEYLHARFADFPSGPCTTPKIVTATVLGGVASGSCNLSGFHMPSAPDFSFNISANYVVPTSVGPLTFTMSDGYKSQFYWEPDNRLTQPSYHVVNGSIEWASSDRRYGVQVFVRNLTGSYYYTGAAVVAGNDVYSPGAPRTFGVVLKFHY